MITGCTLGEDFTFGNVHMLLKVSSQMDHEKILIECVAVYTLIGKIGAFPRKKKNHTKHQNYGKLPSVNEILTSKWQIAVENNSAKTHLAIGTTVIIMT